MTPRRFEEIEQLAKEPVGESDHQDSAVLSRYAEYREALRDLLELIGQPEAGVAAHTRWVTYKVLKAQLKRLNDSINSIEESHRGLPWTIERSNLIRTLTEERDYFAKEVKRVGEEGG